LLNRDDLEDIAENFGRAMTMPANYSEILSHLATARVRVLLSAIMEHPDYQEKVAGGNLSFLRSDRVFEKCMEMAYKKWRWVHKRLA
jgi:hypothetical protein